VYALISGALVVIGVFLAENLRRASDAKSKIDDATLKAQMRVPAFMVLLKSPPSTSDQRAQVWREEQEIAELFYTIDLYSRRRFGAIKRRAQIRAACDVLHAQVFASWYRWSLSGIVVTDAQILGLPMSNLVSAAFGDRETIDELMKKYMKDGLEG